MSAQEERAAAKRIGHSRKKYMNKKKCRSKRMSNAILLLRVLFILEELDQISSESNGRIRCTK